MRNGEIVCVASTRIHHTVYIVCCRIHGELEVWRRSDPHEDRCFEDAGAVRHGFEPPEVLKVFSTDQRYLVLLAGGPDGRIRVCTMDTRGGRIGEAKDQDPLVGHAGPIRDL